ncbi:MAG: hypothetical protein LQ344_006666 [Seirophora lacunosa]|nr:MAG: hypothetical protein LQ344_006666 [Seirophora lacunosa]
MGAQVNGLHERRARVITNHYHILRPTSSHDPVQDTVVRDVADKKEAEPPNDRHDERHTKAESVISDRLSYRMTGQLIRTSDKSRYREVGKGLY